MDKTDPDTQAEETDGALKHNDGISGLINILQLQAAQLMNARDDNDNAMTQLITAHSTLINHIPDKNSSDEAKHSLDIMVVSFQEHDSLNQRLEHISHTLKNLAETLTQPESLANPETLHAFTSALGSQYTMEAERQIFESITGLSLHPEGEPPPQEGGSIDIF